MSTAVAQTRAITKGSGSNEVPLRCPAAWHLALLCPYVGRVRRPAAGLPPFLVVQLRGTGEFRLSFVQLLGVPRGPAAGLLRDGYL